MPEVSVIIPVYNGEKYLKECLDSVLAQTMSDIEAICINDGSTDDSLKILQEYQNKDRRIKIINQSNQGQAVARNRAFAAAEGRYIGYVDCDDWIPKDFYEKLYNAAEKTDADIAGCNIISVKENETKHMLKLKKQKVYQTTPDKYKAFNVPKLNYIWNKIYRRDFMQKHHIFFPEGMFFEDILFTHQALDCCAKAVTVPDTVYFYRQNPDSTVNTMNETKERQFKQALIDAQNYVCEKQIKIDLSKYPRISKRRIKFLGINIGKVQEWRHLKKYHLFGIKVFQKQKPHT